MNLQSTLAPSVDDSPPARIVVLLFGALSLVPGHGIRGILRAEIEVAAAVGLGHRFHEQFKLDAVPALSQRKRPFHSLPAAI